MACHGCEPDGPARIHTAASKAYGIPHLVLGSFHVADCRRISRRPSEFVSSIGSLFNQRHPVPAF